ncbi:MAG: hypothetical protein LBS27_04270 [Bifidobacteriaceae bacterium]|nr:hypothetical protein [Bifidobacteriaceae bacterium]
MAHSRYERNRTVIIDGQEEFYGAPIGQFEDHIAAVRSAIAETKAPDNVAPGDTYAVLRSIDSAKAKLAETINTLVPIVERVKSDVHSFLVTTENELELGQARAGIFTRAQRYVNGSLAQYAPKALEQFVAAQDRLDDASPEDLAQAATSCRRMLKSLADALYPATGQSVMGADGVERVMSDDAYRNRLLQYVSETLGKHGQAAVVQSTLDTLGPRLESLDKLASKGVHSEVTAAEAEICVVWTYLLAADLVRIADRSSALLVAKPEPLREEAGPTAGIPRAGHPPVGT